GRGDAAHQGDAVAHHGAGGVPVVPGPAWPAPRGHATGITVLVTQRRSASRTRNDQRTRSRFEPLGSSPTGGSGSKVEVRSGGPKCPSRSVLCAAIFQDLFARTRFDRFRVRHSPSRNRV